MSVHTTKMPRILPPTLPRFGRNTGPQPDKPPEGEAPKPLDDAFFLSLDPKTLFNDLNRPAGLKKISLSYQKEKEPPPPAETASQPVKNPVSEPAPIAPQGAASAISENIPPLVLPEPNSESLFKESLVKKENRQMTQALMKGALVLAGMGVGYLLKNGLKVGSHVLLSAVGAPQAVGIITYGLFYLSDAISRMLVSDAMSEKVGPAISRLKNSLGKLLGFGRRTVRFGSAQEPGLRQDPAYRAVADLWNTLNTAEQAFTKADTPDKRKAVALELQSSIYDTLGNAVRQCGSDTEKAQFRKMDAFIADYQAYDATVPAGCETLDTLPPSQRQQLQSLVQRAQVSGIEPLSAWGRVVAAALETPEI